jgi:signal transduction histidine kinase
MSALVVISIITYLTLAIKLFRDDKTTLIYDLNANVARTLGSEFRGDLEHFSSVMRLLAQGARDSDWTRVVLSNENRLLAFRIYEPKASPGSDVVRTAAIDREKNFLEEKAIPRERWEEWLARSSGRFEGYAASATPHAWAGPVLESEFLGDGAPVLVIGEQVRFEGVPVPRTLYAVFRIDDWWATLRSQGVVSPVLVDSVGDLLLSANPEDVKDRAAFRRHPLVQEALSSPVALALRSFKWNGKDYLGAFSDIGRAGVKLVSAAPAELVYRASLRLVNKSVLFGLLIVTLALLLSTRVAHSLTRPLHELVDATQSVSVGKFEKKLAIVSNDEVGELSQAFNSMAAGLDRLQRQLIESERHAAIGQVARGVGHEFGNILMRVYGKIDIALLDATDETLKANLRVALDALDRAKAILQNLRSYSKTSAPGAEETRREPVSLATVFDQTLTLSQHELKVGNIEVVRDYVEAPTVLADAPALGQVFLNLVINARQAMPKGGRLEIAIRPKERLGRAGVEIVVRDSGTGIPAEVLPRIFETAFSTKGEQGSGLGLSISKDIIEGHSGKISADSTPGAGAVFTIWLPSDGGPHVA